MIEKIKKEVLKEAKKTMGTGYPTWDDFIMSLTFQKTAQAIFEDIEKDIAKEIKRLDKYEQKYKKKGDKKKERFFRHAILIIRIKIRNNIVRVHKKKYTGGD